MSRDIALEEKIDAYVKGRLSDDEGQELWAELLQNPEYIDLLNTELGLKSILEDQSRESGNNNSVEDSGVIYSLRKSWKWTAAAAAVILIIIGINFFQANTNQNIREMTLGNIDVAQNIMSAPVVRSQKGGITPADSLLNKGFEATISGEVEKALSEYRKIIEKYPNEDSAIRAYLNIGIIEYNTGDYKEAIVSLKHVANKNVGNDITQEKGYWYMGNAYININKLSKARDAIHTTYAMNGIYRDSAFRLLRKLDYELGNVDYDNFEQQMKGR